MPDALQSATQGLLRRFRRQRPLRGGSLIVTIFGDAIAPRGGAATLGSLIELSRPFGLTERLVRTSVARLAQEDWLTARREGRLSEYRLTAHGQQRFAEATRRIYGKNPRGWPGRWTLLLLPPGRGRDRLRDELKWLGFGRLSPDVLAHPGMSLATAREQIRAINGARTALLLEATSEALEADRRLAAAGWDLGALGRSYRRFLDTFEPVDSAVAARGRLAPEHAFVIRTLLIHEYRKIHLRDPLLPPELLPEHWIGNAAYELCRRLYPAVFAAAERFLSETARTTRAPLPQAEPAAYARFGGIPVYDGRSRAEQEPQLQVSRR